MTQTQNHHCQTRYQRKGKRDKKKNCRKHKKDDSSDPSSSDDSDSSNDSDYRHKRRKRKSNWEKDPIKLCARLTKKFLTTAYKSKIIRFKMDEDPLQHRINFLTFVESLKIIFSQHTETCADSRINYESRINSPIRPNFDTQLTQPT